jgi:hypothetical protein
VITFKQFLAEEKEFDLDKFKDDCDYILQMLSGTRGHDLLWHGTNSNTSPWVIRKWEPRTGPRDNPDEMHKEVNSVFVDLLGEPIRDWMFTTGREKDAGVYGLSHVIFPIGKFEWACGADEEAAKDMMGWMDRIRAGIRNADVDRTLTREETKKLAIRHLAGKIKHVNWNFNKNLVKCIQSENEIMIKCGDMYLIKYDSDVYRKILWPFLKTL